MKKINQIKKIGKITNGTKALLLGTGAVIAGAVTAGLVSHRITKSLVNTALDREAPSSMKKRNISGEKKVTEFDSKLEAMEGRLVNSELETLEINGHDGEKLIAHYHHRDDDRRIIIAMHGWRSSWSKDFGPISEFWHKNGCSVLYVEQRGQNNSGGEYMGFGMIERYDCLDWIYRINESNPDRLPIYLAGVSMGAATVLMTSGFKLPDNVHGIMADCGFTSAQAIWKHVAKNNMHLPYGPLHLKYINRLCEKKIQLTADAYSTTEALRENTVPVLFVHGSDDEFVPIEMTYENYKACNAPKRLLIVPGAGHSQSYLVDKVNYEREVKSFWKDYDEKA